MNNLTIATLVSLGLLEKEDAEKLVKEFNHSVIPTDFNLACKVVESAFEKLEIKTPKKTVATKK